MRQPYREVKFVPGQKVTSSKADLERLRVFKEHVERIYLIQVFHGILQKSTASATETNKFLVDLYTFLQCEESLRESLIKTFPDSYSYWHQLLIRFRRRMIPAWKSFSQWVLSERKPNSKQKLLFLL